MSTHTPRTALSRLAGVAAIAVGIGWGLASTAHAQAPSRTRDYDGHIAKLRKKLADEEFTIVVAPPFVVIGDEDPDKVRERAEEIVTWAVKLLKKQFFARDPAEILDIWLFKDKESYEEHAEALFGKKPETPYGYFSARDRALVMNIDTGGGTLVHEIVHPLMAANFPKCPPWFNEGMGSLYERSHERDGRIVGGINWRLPGLQKAIRRDQLSSFEELCAMTEEQFYGDDRGTNYAQARYLCYYLQEHDLLEKYYREFHAHAKQDPGGYETLKKVLDRSDMKAFQEEWEDYVLDLDYR